MIHWQSAKKQQLSQWDGHTAMIQLQGAIRALVFQVGHSRWPHSHDTLAKCQEATTLSMRWPHSHDSWAKCNKSSSLPSWPHPVGWFQPHKAMQYQLHNFGDFERLFPRRLHYICENSLSKAPKVNNNHLQKWCWLVCPFAIKYCLSSNAILQGASFASMLKQRLVFPERC